MMRRDFVGHMMKSGCRLERESQGHSWWINSAFAKRSSVPRHSELADVLVEKICSDLGIDRPK